MQDVNYRTLLLKINVIVMLIVIVNEILLQPVEL